MKLDITKIIGEAQKAVKSCELAPGVYKRYNDGENVPNPYGCADAANILYSICRFPSSEAERGAFAAAMRGMQDERTGLFSESTHHPIHTTAHVTAALELFEAKPLYPMTELLKYSGKPELVSFLDSLDWLRDPWSQSHRGAGLFASLTLTDSVGADFTDAYFGWLDDNFDPETGFLRRGFVGRRDSARLYAHMAGTFHYLFNYEYMKRPMPYPDKTVDSCIKLWNERSDIPRFCREVSFLEIDLAFCLNRARRQTSHRFDEASSVLADFAADFIGWLGTLDYKVAFRDLHGLFGCVCALAELQSAVPGLIVSEKPLRLVLDRRPFI